MKIVCALSSTSYTRHVGIDANSVGLDWYAVTGAFLSGFSLCVGDTSKTTERTTKLTTFVVICNLTLKRPVKII